MLNRGIPCGALRPAKNTKTTTTLGDHISGTRNVPFPRLDLSKILRKVLRYNMIHRSCGHKLGCTSGARQRYIGHALSQNMEREG